MIDYIRQKDSLVKPSALKLHFDRDRNIKSAGTILRSECSYTCELCQFNQTQKRAKSVSFVFDRPGAQNFNINKVNLLIIL